MMDAPKTDSWRELRLLVADKRYMEGSCTIDSVGIGRLGVYIKTKVFVPESVVSFTVRT